MPSTPKRSPRIFSRPPKCRGRPRAPEPYLTAAGRRLQIEYPLSPAPAIQPSAISRSANTVEDCLDKVGNRFDLVLLASKRARQLEMGSKSLVEEDNDKPTVLALREIAEGLINEEAVDAIDAKEKPEDLFETPEVPRPAEGT